MEKEERGAADLKRTMIAEMLKVRRARHDKAQGVIVAKQVSIGRDAKAQAGVMADSWSEEEMDRLLLKLHQSLWLKKMDELYLKKEMKTDVEEGAEMDADDRKVFAFRQRWIEQWSDQCRSLVNVTRILSMPFTYIPAPKCAYPCDTLQIYSAQVAELTGGLDWPLEVFGMVAVRDSVDRKLNIAFYRSRDNCQILTEKDPYLALTGPTRTVCLDSNTDVVVEVDLKVRGKVESEDRHLSFLARPLSQYDHAWKEQYVFDPLSVLDSRDAYCYVSKCSMLKLTYAPIESSVEATIFIRSEGSWPYGGLPGHIIAGTYAERGKVVLLEFGADRVPVSSGGDVELSRHVVSVNSNDLLVVSCTAWAFDRYDSYVEFKAAAAGRSYGTLWLGTCKLEVIVAWSLASPEPDGTLSWC